MDLELSQRAAVVAEARSWLRTRFHHAANCKRNGEDPGGVDCANLLIEAHCGAGLAPRFRPDHYPHDWHMHRNEERFLATLAEHLQLIGEGEDPIERRGDDFSARPGNVLIWRFGRTFSHGAIVSEWPLIVHASFPAEAVVEESALGGILAQRPMRIYSFWGR